MNTFENPIPTRLDAKELRQIFDQTFAEPDRRHEVAVEDFLAIRLGVRRFALRVAELTRIEVDRKLVPLPGADPWLIGLTNCQGKLVPVHSLELVLKLEQTDLDKRWLLIHGQTDPLGLVFDLLEGYVRVPKNEIIAAGSSEFLKSAVRDGSGELRPVINLPSVLDAVQRRISDPRISTKFES